MCLLNSFKTPVFTGIYQQFTASFLPALVICLISFGSMARASEQVVYVVGEPVAVIGQTNSLTVGYTASDSTLTGLGLRFHYDSNLITVVDLPYVLANDLIYAGSEANQDGGNYDSNDTTDVYLNAAWTSLFGNWPNMDLPTELITISFEVADIDADETEVCFSSSSNASGFDFVGGCISLPVTRDSDNDGYEDHIDAFPFDPTEWLDTDADGIGNNADTDDDNDGVDDIWDVFPLDASESVDTDADGIGNNADTDDDNDGVADTEDAFPLDASESMDTDFDGIGNNSDPDDDNDGVLDLQDAFPLDASESVDTDSDGVGNNADTDDDNDSVPDNEDQDPLDPTIGRPTQIISVMDDPFGVIGSYTSVDIGYNTSNDNNQVPGLGFRIHYNSAFLSLIDAVDILPEDLIVSAEGPFFDSEDHDNDESTDLYISVGCASLYNNWPDMELPTKLLTLNFNISEAIDTDTATLTDIKFSKISTPWGYDFEPLNYEMDILAATWDFDGNGEADALTDGLILLRYAFGLRGEIMTDSVIASDSTMTSSEVELAVNNALVIADIDGDGQVDALSDGLLLLRYLFGLNGEPLINGIISTHATLTSVQEIEQHLQKFMPQ